MQGLIFWLALLLIIETYMTLWFGIARLTRRYDVVDSAWGLGFVLTAWVSLLLGGRLTAVTLVSALLVSLWGSRLFGHIANRNWRKQQDDHRYEALRQKWGSAHLLKAYTNVFLVQGVLILMVSLPMIAIARQPATTMNLGVGLGWAIWLVGIGFEALADYQLTHFLNHRPQGSHQLMDTGLWRYSRHPNYFGEIVTWLGAAIVATSVGGWWGIAGAVVITLLITKISGIPPLEKHYRDNADYQAYSRKTSVLLPLPTKKANSDG